MFLELPMSSLKWTLWHFMTTLDWFKNFLFRYFAYQLWCSISKLYKIFNVEIFFWYLLLRNLPQTCCMLLMFPSLLKIYFPISCLISSPFVSPRSPSPCSLSHPLPVPGLVLSSHFLSTYFPHLDMNGVIYHVTFVMGFFPLACFKAYPYWSVYQSFIIFYGWILFHYICIYCILFIHLGTDRHLGCFLLFAIMK